MAGSPSSNQPMTGSMTVALGMARAASGPWEFLRDTATCRPNSGQVQYAARTPSARAGGHLGTERLVQRVGKPRQFVRRKRLGLAGSPATVRSNRVWSLVRLLLIAGPSSPPERGRLATALPATTSLCSDAKTPGIEISLRSTVPRASVLIR
jgi:hypothetical protein